MPDLTTSADIDAFMASANDAAARTELGLTALATTTPGTGVAAALAINVGSAGAFLTFNGAGGTPSSMVGTNITGTAAGLTAGAVAVGGITGLGANVGTFLATPSSANLLAAVTGETGTGALVFGSSPTIDAPTLTGTTTAATVNATTGNVTTFRILDAVDQSHGMQFVIASDLTQNRTLTFTTGDANRAITIQGDVTLPAGTALVSGGALGTPASGTLTNATGLPISTGVSGLGTGVATVLGAAANGSASDGPGYRGVPQNSQSAAYTTVMADNGKHILHPTADNNPRTFTIDSNANVAYPIGASITFINQINTVTIAITSDTMVLAGAGTTGSRTLAANGIATAVKIASTTWIINGTGLT